MCQQKICLIEVQWDLMHFYIHRYQICLYQSVSAQNTSVILLCIYFFVSTLKELLKSSAYSLNYSDQHIAACIFLLISCLIQILYTQHSWVIWERIHVLLCDGNSPFSSISRWLRKSTNHLEKEIMCENLKNQK